MSGIKAFVLNQEEKSRGPISIAFFLTKRNIFPTIDSALETVNRYYARPELAFWIGGIKKDFSKNI